MARKGFKAKEHIKELNALKAQFVKVSEGLSESEFRQGLKSCGIPSGIIFWRELLRVGLITKVGPDKFQFSDKKPIHYAALNEVYNIFRLKVSNWCNKTRKNLKIASFVKNQATQEAIKLLTSHGFIVFSPTHVKGEEDIVYKKL